MKNIFNGGDIPQDIENKVLLVYTDISVLNDEQDLPVRYLFQMLSVFKINKKLLIDLDVKEYCIDGTKILDIDKLVCKIGELIVLNDKLSVIVKSWLLLMKSLNISEGIFEYKITARDLNKLNDELAIQNDVISMISNFTTRSYINFKDFAIIMGKLNQL